MDAWDGVHLVCYRERRILDCSCEILCTRSDTSAYLLTQSMIALVPRISQLDVFLELHYCSPVYDVSSTLTTCTV